MRKIILHFIIIKYPPILAYEHRGNCNYENVAEMFLGRDAFWLTTIYKKTNTALLKSLASQIKPF